MRFLFLARYLNFLIILESGHVGYNGNVAQVFWNADGNAVATGIQFPLD